MTGVGLKTLSLPDRVREGLATAAERVRARGLPATSLEGQLIRPLVAYAAWLELYRTEPDDRFWLAVLAVQMAHEASLVHDDVVDGARERRGRPTVAARAGTARALLEGDHLLTAAFRVATSTQSLRFADLLARAVERTVAGERSQAAAAGVRLAYGRYLAVVTEKSGGLFGSALAAGPALAGDARTEAVYRVGTRLGVLYQMLDDLLDYCPGAKRGKPALQDYAQGRWTWPLMVIGDVPFGATADDVVALLHAPVRRDRSGPSGMHVAVAHYDREVAAFRRSLAELGCGGLVPAELLDGWCGDARAAVRAEERRRAEMRRSVGAETELRSRVSELAAIEPRLRFFARNSRSFRFAARFFPRRLRDRVAGVYAFCRFTDDLADGGAEDIGARTETPPAPDRIRRLDAWQALAQRAYEGQRTGIALLDEVMAEMAGAGAPFTYVRELVEGMRMDLRGHVYRDRAELRTYTYRVASVVGMWLTRLFGVHDVWVLERAIALGHAMQLTNIVRDVGEDLARGRLYLPADLLARHGVERSALEAALRDGTGPPEGYPALLDSMMDAAERDYARAFEAMPYLPPRAQVAVAIAAAVYRGIHDEVRRNGYDNLRLRAVTSRARKVRLAAVGLAELARAWARRTASQPGRSPERSRDGPPADAARA